jgi:glycosyltransferase involved in cell wall biosynthesis
VRKVLNVVADGAPGGGTTAVLGLCHDLVVSGWTTALVTQKDSYGFHTGLALGIEAYGLDFFRSRIDPTVPRKLAAVLDVVRPDVVHVHGGRAGHAFCSRLLRRKDVPMVYTVHGYHFLKKALPRRILGWAAERRIGARADQVVFVSKNDQRIARRWGLARLDSNATAVIYNGIDPAELDAIARPPVTFDLAFVGRMHIQKNPLFAVRVMAALVGDGFRLLFVGGGDLDEQVRAYAAAQGVADQITFTGELGRREALAALASARVYLFPSLWEGLPIGPIEAMYYGVPVIGSRVGGTDEVVEDGVTGLLIDDFDPFRYAAAVRRVLGDQRLYSSMAEAGRRRVESLFLRTASTARYRALYEHVS